MNTEYVGAVVLLIVGVLKIFGIFVSADAITGIITGSISLYLAIKQYGKGDITLGGFRK